MMTNNTFQYSMAVFIYHPLKEYHQPTESWAYPLCYFACSSSIVPPKSLFWKFHTVFGYFGKNVCPQLLTLIGKPWFTYTSYAPKPTTENHAFHKAIPSCNPRGLAYLQPYRTKWDFPPCTLCKAPKLH